MAQWFHYLIPGNGFRDEGIERLFVFTESNKTLKEVELGCKSEEEVLYISFLASFRTPGNYITGRGVRAMLPALQGEGSLESLDLRCARALLVSLCTLVALLCHVQGMRSRRRELKPLPMRSLSPTARCGSYVFEVCTCFPCLGFTGSLTHAHVWDRSVP